MSPAWCVETSAMEPIYVIGDSHVRTFSFCSAFVPLYVGAGFDNCFLTPALAERTQLRLLRNLERLPGAASVLLVFGEPDVRFQIEDRFGTRALGNGQAIAASTARYAGTVARLRDTAPAHRIAVMSCIPSVRREYSLLSAEYDRDLGCRLRAKALAFVDVRAGLVDPASQLLRPEFDADGIHLSSAALPPLIALLKSAGSLDPAAPEGPDFSWSFNYRIPIADGMESRLWGDKRRTAAADAAVAHLSRKHSAEKPARWLVLDCAEGYIAFALASAGFGNVVAMEPDRTKLMMARRAGQLYRGPESAVAFHAGDHADVAADYAVLAPWSGADPVTIASRLSRAAANGTRCYALLTLGDAAQVCGLQAQCRPEIEPIGVENAEFLLLRCFDEEPRPC